jgi:hypothetical protein
VSAGDTDPTDPAVRAARRVRDFERRQRAGRTALASILGGFAVVAPFVAAPLTGDPGATVGAVVGSLLLAGCAVAVWPWAWSAQEREHHELMAIWSQARTDAQTRVPWDRHVAWARADGERVALLLLCWAASSDDPSPLSVECVRHVDADDVPGAAAAMEELREQVAQMEPRARDAHLLALSIAERRAYDDALRRVDATAEADQRRAEEQMRREVADEDAAERRAQASAVARALRRR